MENYTKQSKKKIANSMPKMATGQGTAVTLKSIMTVHSKKGTFIHELHIFIKKHAHVLMLCVHVCPSLQNTEKEGPDKGKTKVSS